MAAVSCKILYCQRCYSHAPKHRLSVCNAYQPDMHCNCACWTTSTARSVTKANRKQRVSCYICYHMLCWRFTDWQMPLSRATGSCNRMVQHANDGTTCQHRLGTAPPPCSMHCFMLLKTCRQHITSYCIPCKPNYDCDFIKGARGMQ